MPSSLYNNMCFSVFIYNLLTFVIIINTLIFWYTIIVCNSFCNCCMFCYEIISQNFKYISILS